MAKLIYPINMSVDGYMEDRDGKLDWSITDDEVFTFWTDFQQSIGTYLHGRNMYESMVFWETAVPQIPSNSSESELTERMQQFTAIWQSANKVIYSQTLQEVSSAQTWLEREFQPEAIKEWKKTAKNDLTIGGAELAGQAMKAGLVDECHLLVHPILLGGGKQALPNNLHLPLQLLNERRFKSGMVHLHYRLNN